MRRLLIRPGAIGDCIVSLPALECLRAEYTEVWVASPNVPLIRFADAVRAIPATRLDLLEIRGAEAPAALIEDLRGFDSIVSWYGANREEFRSTVRQLQLPFHFLAALPEESRVHAVDFYLAQVGQALPPAVAIPRIQCPAVPRRFAVIHPFSGSARKIWPLERYAQVAERLSSQMPVEWCAGPSEELANARRFDDLYELACWLARARLYVGNDSGITHLAAAVGTPVVALFGPTDPRMWAPRGPAVRIVSTPSRNNPIDGISVEEVLRAVEQAL